jgi:hypothetical protein
MNNFINNIFDQREKPISDNSRNLYRRNLEKLNDNQPITDFKFLENIKEVLFKIKDYKPTTQRTFIISICTVLRNNNEELYNQYYEILSKMNNNLKVNTSKSDKQKENWMSDDDVQKIYNDLKEKVSKNKSKSKASYEDLLNYMVLSLYVLTAPRRNIDYSLLRMSSDTHDTKFNYLDLEQREFVFNNYKTQGKYNSVSVPIPDDLMKVIVLYLKNHPLKIQLKNKKHNVHFLVNYFGVNIDKSQQMTKILNAIFDKKIGSSMLRNMYLTNKYGSLMNELKSDTADMGTSVDVALNNYIKEK